jgi:hypothetical protein
MNFDFNVNNYKKEELEEILGLTSSYDSSTIELNANNMKKNVLNDNSINAGIKDKTIIFLNSIKNILTNDLMNLKNNLNKVLETDIYNINYDLKSSKTINEGNDFIIEKNPTPYTMSLPSEYYPGKINPLKKKIINKNLNIDTRFRDNYYNSLSTNFNINLPIKFSNVVSMQVSSFEIPVTIYTISGKLGNNFFWILATNNEDIDGFADEKLSITIPDGNYLADDLIFYLNNYVNTNPNFQSSNLLKYLTFYINISGTTNNSGSGQVVIGILSTFTTTYPTHSSFNFSLNFQYDANGNPDYSTPLPLKLGWLMGFRQGCYEDNTSYVSEAIINITGPNYIYLVVDDFNNNVNNGFYSAFNSSILNKNILARITLQTATYDILSQNNLSLITNPREYFGPVDIQRLNIQLLDEYGRIIDLNNMDFSFCLTMKEIYDL